jgi:hypothetical protein
MIADIAASEPSSVCSTPLNISPQGAIHGSKILAELAPSALLNRGGLQMVSQKPFNFSTLFSGELPAMMAQLNAPIEIPATQLG